MRTPCLLMCMCTWTSSAKGEMSHRLILCQLTRYTLSIAGLNSALHSKLTLSAQSGSPQNTQKYCSWQYHLDPECSPFLHDMQAALDTSSEGVHVPSYDAWDSLSLTYDLKWPLHILLTPEVDHIGTQPC